MRVGGIGWGACGRAWRWALVRIAAGGPLGGGGAGGSRWARAPVSATELSDGGWRGRGGEEKWGGGWRMGAWKRGRGPGAGSGREGIFGEIRENSGTGGMVAWADGRGGGAIWATGKYMAVERRVREGGGRGGRRGGAAEVVLINSACVCGRGWWRDRIWVDRGCGVGSRKKIPENPWVCGEVAGRGGRGGPAGTSPGKSAGPIGRSNGAGNIQAGWGSDGGAGDKSGKLGLLGEVRGGGGGRAAGGNRLPRIMPELADVAQRSQGH